MAIVANILEFVNSGLNPNGVFEVLKREHREASALMEQVEQSKPGAAARTSTFEHVSAVLMAHARAEEEVLYSALKAIDGTHDLSLEAEQEHHVIELLLGELRVGVRGEEWMAAFHVLKENVDHHVREEEEKFFPKARTVLTVTRQIEMANAFVAARDRLLAEGKGAAKPAARKKARPAGKASEPTKAAKAADTTKAKPARRSPPAT